MPEPMPLISNYVSETSSFDVALRRILRAVLRQKVLFLVSFCIVAAGGLSGLFMMGSTYRATATAALTAAPVNPVGTNSTPTTDPTEADDWPLTVTSMMQSREVAAAVLKALPPPPSPPGIRDRICQAGIRLACRKVLSAAALQEAQIDGFLKTLSVLPEPHSRMIDIQVSSGEPARAAALADAVVQFYQQIALSQQKADSDRVVAWLNQRTAALKQSWLDAQQQADAFSASHKLAIVGSGAGSGPLVNQQLSAVAANLAIAETQLDSAQSEDAALHDAARNGDTAALVTLPSQPVMVSAANSLMQLQTQRDQLSAEFGPNYPKIQALDQQIASAKANFGEQTGTALGSIRENLVSAKRQVQQLTAQLNTLRTQAVSEQTEDFDYTTLSTRAASLSAEYETFLQHADDIMDRSALMQAPVTLVSPAEVPLNPAYPSKPKFGLGIILLALATGAATAVMRDRSVQGFAQADELRASLQLPLLATLPKLSGKPETIRMHVIDEPYSRTSEGVRGIVAILALRASKLRAGKKSGSQCVLVTSAGALEGKSTVATWLALTAHNAGRRALLIDGDHRRGTLMRDAARTNAPGLTELLAGNAAIDEVVQADPQTGMAFMIAGAAAPRSFGGVDLALLRKVLDELKRTYDLIVIDSPPLLAMVDGLVLGSVADQTIFVCRWQHSSKQSISMSLERLRSHGAKLAGVVVSMVEQRAALEFAGEYAKREFKLINQLYGS